MDTKICTFENIFNQLPNKKINVISTCLFKLKISYKNFNAYLYRAKNVKLLAQKLKFYLLVFIDDSIYNNKDIYKKLIRNIGGKYTIFLKYDCNAFKDDEGLHRGTFGTLIRFFPMFDFPGNNFGTVLVIDIDYVKPKLYKDDNYYCTMYDLLKENNLDFIGRSHANLMLDDKWINIKPPYMNEDKVSIIANCLFSTKKFDHNLIIDYLNTLLNKKSKLHKLVKEHTTKNLDTVFNYGVDEYFLNHILYPYFKENKIKFWCMAVYSISHFMDKLKELYEGFKETEETKDSKKSKEKDTNNSDFKKLYKLLLQCITNNKSDDLNKLYEIYKKCLETDNIPLTKEQTEMINRFYTFLECLKNKKIYSLFDKQALDFVLLHKGYRECLDRFEKPKTTKLISMYKYNICKYDLQNKNYKF